MAKQPTPRSRRKPTSPKKTANQASETPRLSAPSVIIKKRDGQALDDEEIRGFIASYMLEQIPDYQMSAFLMATLFRGMNDRETVALTEALLHSGQVLTLPSVKEFKVDKHSTGGVGDKVSLCLAPLVAAVGVKVPMISGRGLGHTGGTLDKLEAIVGYQTRLSAKRFEQVVRRVGASIIGQTAELAPADRRIYALRDVTGTVESIPLIVASILSKKLAEGIDGLVLDVKVGRGAFMKDRTTARALGKALVSVGRRAGKRVTAVLTDMDTPIGKTIGNALETREAIQILHGEGPEDTWQLTLALGIEMVRMAGLAKSAKEAETRLIRARTSGSALHVFRRMVSAHGGDGRVVDDPSRLETAPVVWEVKAKKAGYVADIDPLALGLAAVGLDAGRSRADQAVDFGAGIELEKKVGEKVLPGAVLARLYSAGAPRHRAELARVESAFRIGARAVRPGPLVLERFSR
jgi:pyrimidine-nucleoside phosphorylase